MREDRFRRIYAEHFSTVLGYALRRASSDDAADVTAEVFLVVWRRLPEVPEPPATRLWLYGVARRTLANQRRGTRRRDDLSTALRQELAGAVPDHADAAVARIDAAAGIADLAARDREVLRLATWEELEPREIAEVLGLSAVVVRKRLSRARARLREVTGHEPTPPGHVRGVREAQEVHETQEPQR
ncbi:sigma-70 family RNA polymerase sigma factor [Nocardioides immobilis]|uniref:Sigma-70 family RNA polymerase sigma factor n=2 Tax=Nocardioides immobilis TaxID=2049295 RepID=A0A417XY21_9ACTN|nr:sigma-70 family RNA polymerase sigma factor [Nocardioides immobilis]